ncbi:MAG: hypothetical protein JW940_03085 [Polyangiaceae bacterium]|nr:hypothetical protein [Polyangiaceae bacterium]
MKTRTAVLLALGALLAAGGACGGKLGDSSNPKDQTANKDGTGGRGENDTLGRAGADGATMSNRTLEACKPGFRHEDQPGRTCPYITDDGRCYETPEAACDCACPRGKAGAIVCVQYGGSSEYIEVFCETT